MIYTPALHLKVKPSVAHFAPNHEINTWQLPPISRNLGDTKDNGIKMNITELVTQFNALVHACDSFCRVLRQQQPSCWVPLTEQEKALGMTPIDKACSLIQDFWYQDGQDGRETRSGFGIVALNETQIQQAETINKLKEEFKLSITQLQKEHKEAWRDLRGQLGRSLNDEFPNIREQLKYSGMSRLHIKQTWRTLPVINRTPNRIGFNWYQSGRSIQKITVQQAQESLLKLDTTSDHIQTQLHALAQLKRLEPLAKVQMLAPIMRANLFYEDGQSPLRQAMNVSLPVFIKEAEDGALPPHNDPDLTAPSTRQRKIRSDRKIEDEPFLPSIRVHRYFSNQ